MPAAFVGLESWLLAVLFGSVRAAAAFLVAPGFAVARVPVPIRVFAGLSVGWLIASRVAVPPVSFAGLIAAVAGEAVVGLAIGLVAQLAVAAVAMAGEIVSAALGLSFATLFDPANGQSSAVGELFRLFAVALFFAGGGHVAMVAAVVESYAALPLGGGLPRDVLWRLVVLGGEALAAGVAIALPMGVALLALNLAAGFVTRIAPQLNMFAVAVPVTLTAGLFALLLLFDGIGAGAERAIDGIGTAGFALVAGR